MNLSVISLQDENFLSALRQIVEHSGVDARRLEFELNEPALMAQVEQLSDTMLEVNKLGPVFLVDEFGTGYSSFPQLQRLPISAVKIDRSLVQSLQHSDADARIVQAMINLAKSLELTVIADGADALEQALFLQQNGCNQLQGYYFSPAVPFDALCELLNDKTVLAV